MAPRPILKPKCHNCRRKKIQCDNGRPSCGQCLTKARPCEGYDRDLVFVHAKREPQRRVRLPRRQKLDQIKEGDGSDKSQEESSKLRRGGLEQRPEHDALIHPPRAGNIHADMLWDEFMDFYAPNKSRYENICLIWLNGLPTARRKFPPLDMAVKALTLMTLGPVKGADTAPVEAVRLYGQAMAGLRNWHINYRNLDRTCWHEALMTSVVFQLYEAVDYGDVLSAGFHNHIQGVTVLINQRGPRLFADPTFHSILSLCRATVWVRSLLGGSQPITEAAWSTMKWGPHIPNEMGHLFDVLMSLPLLLDESNRLSEHEQHSEQEYESLIASLDNFTSNIAEWETAATKRAGRPLYYHTPIQGKNKIIFHTSDDSALMMYTWSSRVFLYTARMKVQNASPWAHRESTDNQDATAWFDATTAADNIRNAMEYCVSPRVCGLGGLMLTIVPLMALKEFCKRCNMSREVYSTAVGEYTSALERGRAHGNADEKVRYGLWFSAPMEAEPSHGSS